MQPFLGSKVSRWSGIQGYVLVSDPHLEAYLYEKRPALSFPVWKLAAHWQWCDKTGLLLGVLRVFNFVLDPNPESRFSGKPWTCERLPNNKQIPNFDYPRFQTMSISMIFVTVQGSMLKVKPIKEGFSWEINPVKACLPFGDWQTYLRKYETGKLINREP